MKAHSKKPSSFGFSLVEVVIAVAIVGIAIPTVLGVQAIFSSMSSVTMDRGEVASAVNALQLYLNGKVKDPGTSASVPFASVYGWVYAARQAPVNAQVIYGYKTNANQTDYSFSQTAPTGAIEGKLLAAEILAPDVRVLSTGMLVSDSANYSRAYLPLKVSIYALSTAAQRRTGATFVDSYPMIISK